MIGQTLAHYRILAKLGQGGMGAVYLAEDTELDRRVALKLLPPEVAGDRERLARFLREAKTVARINHPSVVTLHAVEEHAGVQFIVMEHVEGSTLDRLIGPGGMPLRQFFDIACAVAEALRAAHEQGVVHRDLKPSNIMVTAGGLVKVLDFGLAKLQSDATSSLEDGATDLQTRSGVVLGTVPYMSPEQAAGRGTDARSDLFSLGIVLYQMASGGLPFRGASSLETISSILKDVPDPLRARRPELPNHLARIIHRCLEKDPADRYASARELAIELRRLRDELSSGSAPPPAAATPSSEPAVDPRAPTQIDSGAAAPSTTRADDAAAGFHAPRPAVRRRWPAIAVAVGGIALLGLILWARFAGEPAPVAPDTTAPRAEATRLAVLPFSNLRRDPETDFLGYALADQVIGALAYIRNLTVRPSSSVRQYQHGNYDLDAVRDELAVNFALAGNYLRQGDRMRLTVELIDLASRETVWREPIEVAYENAFAMQDLVSERLLARLKISFTEIERDRMQADIPQNSLAYEEYLRALSLPESAEGNQASIDTVRRAIELDPNFAPAWAALGRREQLSGYWELGGEAFALRARNAFTKALEINPELIAALGHLTMLYTELGELDLAMATVRRLRAINANSAESHFAYGYLLRYAGMSAESALAMSRAFEIDPSNPTFKSAYWSFVHTGKYPEALAAAALAPADLAAAWQGELAIRRGELDVARAKLSQAVALNPHGLAGLWATGLRAALDGNPAQGLAAARLWEEGNLPDGEGWYFLAGNYCLNGDIAKCVAMLDRAVERGFFAYRQMADGRYFAAARGNPGFEAVVEKARLKHEAFKRRFF